MKRQPGPGSPPIRGTNAEMEMFTGVKSGSVWIVNLNAIQQFDVFENFHLDFEGKFYSVNKISFRKKKSPHNY